MFMIDEEIGWIVVSTIVVYSSLS